MPRVPFAWSSYRHRTLPLSGQRLINVYAEKQPPGAKSEVVLLPTPGMETFTTCGTGQVRGFVEMGGLLFVVSGTEVYKVTAGGTATLVGSLTAGGPVTMAQHGTQCLIIVPETGEGFVATTSSVTQIVDVDFPLASSCTWLDGYFIVSEKDTDAFHLSTLDDATSWPGDTQQAERSPDNLVRVLKVGSVLWLLGETSAEIWSNVGAADFPLAQVSGAYVDRGCASRDSVDERLGTVFWLGDDRVIYRSDNFQPVRISNHAIEQAIAGYERVDDAQGSIYEQEGHIFYCLTFPTAGATWVYDVSTAFWHERATEGRSNYRAGTLGNFAGAAIGGDLIDGRLYTLNPTISTEAGDAVIRTATGTTFHADNKRVFYARFDAEFERGVSEYATGIEGEVFLTFSDDGGRTWSNERWRALGFEGGYKPRVKWERLGSARERVFRLQWSDDVRTALMAVNIEAQAGEH